MREIKEKTRNIYSRELLHTREKISSTDVFFFIIVTIFSY